MKVIVAGPRDYKDEVVVFKAIDKFVEEHGEIEQIVSGKATGVDTIGEKWAGENSVGVEPFPAEWNNLKQPGAVIKTNKWNKKYNANAGFFRNGLMAQYADALVAIDVGTPGTGNMIKQMRELGKIVFVYNPDDNIDDGEIGYEF